MKKIFTFWTGDNEIPTIRKDSLKIMTQNSGAKIILINSKNISEYIDINNIHPSYQYLNLAHRADYLRCYFMHHFGGGYCDIKKISDSWIPNFNLLEQNKNLIAVGYQEINRWGVANLHDSVKQLNHSKMEKIKAKIKYRFYQLNYKSLIGNCAFIFKPQTDLTNEWFKILNFRLDSLYLDLKKNPAKYPKEKKGNKYDGNLSNYPVPWSYLLGDILQPLSFKYRKYISRTLPAPDFKNYQ